MVIRPAQVEKSPAGTLGAVPGHGVGNPRIFVSGWFTRLVNWR
ncbi:hypothetical protein C4K39_1526 [Pseudomonas sessilinigenes]|nr:hypothetical protein C4K39_1526 [Pseudomonas sessilinigenes]